MAQDLNYKSFIWGVADKLRGPYRRSSYGKVILPFVVLRRLDCVLEPTKARVLEAAKETSEGDVARDFTLRKISGYAFYNTSPYDLRKAAGDPQNLKHNLQAYVSGFSPNVRDIFERYEFDTQLNKLEESDLLLLISQEFLRVDLHPEVVDNPTMGHIFEHLIAKAMEEANEESGDYFTPRDVVRLMVNFLFARDDDVLSKSGVVRSIYDPTAGTGGMLSVAEDHIKSMNPDAQLALYGQERNPESYAIAKTDLLIKGQSAENMILGDTLTADGHWGKTFDYGLSNPPFGVEWKIQQQEVRREHEELGFRGRFGAGLPRVSDGALLFVMHLVDKMRPVAEGGGRVCIVLNSSQLMTGAAGSGESDIRTWLVTNDLLEAIVALPKDMFYNTGIPTFLAIIDNSKLPERRGKVQVLNGAKLSKKLRKAVGSKRNELSDSDISALLREYEEFEESTISRILSNEDFLYRRIVIEQPLRNSWDFSPDTLIQNSPEWGTLFDSALEADAFTAELRRQADAESVDRATHDVAKRLVENAGQVVPFKRGAREKILKSLVRTDENAPATLDSRGRPKPSPALREKENVPFHIDPQAYFDEEIKPALPDAWLDDSKVVIGCEIPVQRIFFDYIPPISLEESLKRIRQAAEHVVDHLRRLQP